MTVGPQFLVQEDFPHRASDSWNYANPFQSLVFTSFLPLSTLAVFCQNLYDCQCNVFEPMKVNIRSALASGRKPLDI